MGFANGGLEPPLVGFRADPSRWIRGAWALTELRRGWLCSLLAHHHHHHYHHHHRHHHSHYFIMIVSRGSRSYDSSQAVVVVVLVVVAATAATAVVLMLRQDKSSTDPASTRREIVQTQPSSRRGPDLVATSTATGRSSISKCLQLRCYAVQAGRKKCCPQRHYSATYHVYPV